MSDFVAVAQVSDLPDPGKMTVEVDDQIVVLFHIGGKFYCIDDVCTHDGGPLGEGERDGCQIICPRHGARFDVRTGEALTMPAAQDTRMHEVRVDGNTVSVKLSD